MSTNTQKIPRKTGTGRETMATPCRKQARFQATSVTLPVPLQEAVIRQAKAEDRSFSSLVRRSLEAYLGREPAA